MKDEKEGRVFFRLPPSSFILPSRRSNRKL
jgi:hypothetical protein